MTTNQNPLIWENLTYKKIGDLKKSIPIIIPIGTIEAHGPHLPVNTDTAIPHFLAKRISSQYPSIVGPSLKFGLCSTMMSFPGTITIKHDTLKKLIKDIINSFSYHGFNNFIFLNGHGGNIEIFNSLKSNLKEFKINFLTWYETKTCQEFIANDSSYQGDHANRLETEMMLMIDQSKVDLDKAIDEKIDWPNNWEEITDYQPFMNNSIDGYPTKANLNSAKKLLDGVVNDLIIRIKSIDK